MPSIYEERSFVLFCIYDIHRTRMFQIVFLVSLESSLRGRVHGLWFHDAWTCGAKVLQYWTISSLKIKLNRSWKFERNWNVPLVLLEWSGWAGFNGIYLVRFEFRMWCGRYWFKRVLEELGLGFNELGLHVSLFVCEFSCFSDREGETGRFRCDNRFCRSFSSVVARRCCRVSYNPEAFWSWLLKLRKAKNAAICAHGICNVFPFPSLLFLSLSLSTV